MVRSRLRSLTESMRERVPDPPAVPVPSVRDRLPDQAALGTAGTLLAAAGSALALLGALVRYLSGRGDDEEAESDPGGDVAPAPADLGPPTWDWEGPRIAPLAGFVAVVAMRVYVEWLGDEADGA